jgi:hypothetical protein
VRPASPPAPEKADDAVTLSDLYRAIKVLQEQVAVVATTQQEMRGELAALRGRPDSLL